MGKRSPAIIQRLAECCLWSCVSHANRAGVHTQCTGMSQSSQQHPTSLNTFSALPPVLQLSIDNVSLASPQSGVEGPQEPFFTQTGTSERDRGLNELSQKCMQINTQRRKRRALLGQLYLEHLVQFNRGTHLSGSEHSLCGLLSNRLPRAAHAFNTRPAVHCNLCHQPSLTALIHLHSPPVD